MSRILLLLEHQENRRLLSDCLANRYQVLPPDSGVEVISELPLLEPAFDVCIIDARALDKHWQWAQAIRQAEKPVFLPFLLITSGQDVGMVTRHLWQNIDDLITKPIEKVELQARVEILLRSRQMSLQLNAANKKLQSEITERQQIELALAKSEAKFRALVQNSSDAITVLDADGIVTYQSPSGLKVLGFTSEEMEGKNLFNFIHPDDFSTTLAPFRESLANPGEPQISEYHFLHKDGTWRYLESKSKFLATDHDLNEIIVNSRDITERKQAEKEIRHALIQAQELNEIRSRFISMVSHEIRNPLNRVLAATQILERYSEQWSKEKKQEFFERIKTAVREMTELLDDVLLMGKSDAGKLEAKPAYLELEKFSRDLVAEVKMNTGSNHSVVFLKQGECTNAYLDEKLLRHIFTNLLSNALKYSPQDSTVHFKLFCQNEEAIFQIQDEGIGIPLEDIGQLFESFHRATNVKSIPGTGLGLAIVKRCVDVQGGKIDVKSEVGIGTTFTVTLPLHT